MKIICPLTYGDAIDLWRQAPLTEKPLDHQVAHLLMSIDVASREQARADVDPPIQIRGCVRCSAPGAALELRDHEHDASAYFCSVACVSAFDLAAWAKRIAIADPDERVEASLQALARIPTTRTMEALAAMGPYDMREGR